MIIQNSCFDIKQIFNDYSFPNVNKTWNEKYHSFWLVFLTWISLYLIGFNDLKSKYLTLLIIFYSVFATITSYSDSAKLAMLVSVCIFFISKFHARLVWKSFFIILVIYTLSFPFFGRSSHHTCGVWFPVIISIGFFFSKLPLMRSLTIG